jgi:hypothetical protein
MNLSEQTFKIDSAEEMPVDCTGKPTGSSSRSESLITVSLCMSHKEWLTVITADLLFDDDDHTECNWD